MQCWIFTVVLKGKTHGMLCWNVGNQIFFLELIMLSAEEDFNKTWKQTMLGCRSEFCLYLCSLVFGVISQTLRSVKRIANSLLHPSTWPLYPQKPSNKTQTPPEQSLLQMLNIKPAFSNLVWFGGRCPCPWQGVGNQLDDL